MSSWMFRGLRKGRVTTAFPRKPPESVPAWTTRPVWKGEGDASCPVNAIEEHRVSMGRCISCGYCSSAYEPDGSVDLSTANGKGRIFSRSYHVYLFDAGTCGACNLEIKALTNPVYDMSRLGIFFTSTPKHADAILVSGVMAEGMREPLRHAVEALPEPRLVFAVGACAISGGILGKAISEVIDADVIVPGCPPNPFTILDALLKSRGGS